ncbi:MAG: hypothetical protein U0K66_10200 [Paludibacteraceae bacterium]|nr:hypothetical protein [Paludibacteraceae bacterium]
MPSAAKGRKSNPTDRDSLELCSMYLLVKTDRPIAEANDTMTK